MKHKYESYKLGSNVYALAHHYKDSKKTSYVAIYEAIVSTVYHSIDKKTHKHKLEYWLTTPDGADWGDSVDAKYVSDNIEDLIKLMKPIWKSNSNSHE